MSKKLDLAKELHEYTKVIGSHNTHIQGVASELVKSLDIPILEQDEEIVYGLLHNGDHESIFRLLACIPAAYDNNALSPIELYAIENVIENSEKTISILKKFLEEVAD